MPDMPEAANSPAAKDREFPALGIKKYPALRRGLDCLVGPSGIEPETIRL